MANLRPSGVDTTTGQLKPLTSSDTLVDASGTPVGGGGLANYASFPNKQLPASASDPIYNYPGLSTFNINELAGSFGFLGFGQETDGSQFTSYAEYSWSFEDSTQGPGFSLYIAIPPNFSGWDTNGIQLFHKTTYTGTLTGTSRLTMEALDPVNGGSFGSPKIATRDLSAASSDTTYTALSLSAATLSTDFSAGQLLQLDISGVEQVAGEAVANMRFGQIRLNWN